MGKLITIVGNNASGKTTLTRTLGEQPGFTAWFESHEDRPFQPLFAKDTQRYALPNQIDYLLRRAEQERAIRMGTETGVQDGGLDQDYYLYTRLFHHKGFLTGAEADLCWRTYSTLRAGLPGPELIVWLSAPLDLLRTRLEARGRTIDLEQIVTPDDLPILESYLEEWLGDAGVRVLKLDVSGREVEEMVPLILERCKK